MVSVYRPAGCFKLGDLSFFVSRVLGLKTSPQAGIQVAFFQIPLDSRIACFLKSKSDLRVATELGQKTCLASSWCNHCLYLFSLLDSVLYPVSITYKCLRNPAKYHRLHLLLLPVPDPEPPQPLNRPGQQHPGEPGCR